MIRSTNTLVRGWLCLMLLVLLAPSLSAQQGALRGLDAYIEKGMRDWEVPGLAVAVIKGDSVVFARGYGVRELGGTARVDATTIFAIGSASKAFAAASVAMLVDEQKVRWDDPATRHLPDLQLFDPYATRELTVRDLLTHRSGLSRGDFLWYGTAYDRAEILRRVRHLEPTWSFRSHFGYQNLMYLASGEVVHAVTGESWDDFVSRRIFGPLGMRSSSTSVLGLEGRENVATPHSAIDGQVRPVAWRNIDNVAPAGSINSNVLDMAQWVRLQLGRGTYRGQRIMSEAVVREMHTPQTILPQEPAWRAMGPIANFLVYGIGWFMNDHHGRKVIHHGGNIDGMSALVGMVPEEDLGVVVLTNLHTTGLTHPVMYRIIDSYLGVAPTDWSARALARRDSLRTLARTRLEQVEAARVPGTTPSLELSQYAGRYENAMYGGGTIALENGGLVLRLGPAFTGDLQHWHHDTFQVQWRDPMLGRMFASFALDAMGKVAAMDVQGIAEFRRLPEAARAEASR